TGASTAKPGARSCHS
ncbi:Hypothetical predicted protein, partial [Cloeon dipterum]